MLLVFGGAEFFFFHSPSSNTQTTPYTNPYSYAPSGNSTSVSTSPSTSAASATSTTLLVPTRWGGYTGVEDFLHNGETVPDTVNPGRYYLAGSIGYCLADGTCPSGYKTSDFTITYSASTGVFNVTLLTNPLSTAREEAQTFLTSRLGATQNQMCNLLYYVWVSPLLDTTGIYGGVNVGWSFCPGETTLP
jgi:hypothetical protein